MHRIHRDWCHIIVTLLVLIMIASAGFGVIFIEILQACGYFMLVTTIEERNHCVFRDVFCLEFD